MDGSIYVIGGRGPNEPCSKKNFRYKIKEKRWEEIAESNYPLRKPTVCVFHNKFIFKIGAYKSFSQVVCRVYSCSFDCLIRITTDTHSCCASCYVTLLAWQGSKDRPAIFTVPFVWRRPTHHVSDLLLNQHYFVATFENQSLLCNTLGVSCTLPVPTSIKLLVSSTSKKGT